MSVTRGASRMRRQCSRSILGGALLALAGAALLGAPLPAAAQADSYPTRPVTVIIGYPPGGSTDLTGRTLAAELGRKLPGNVVVENLSGAVGAIAAQKVLGSPADGYTLLVGSNSDIAINRLVSSSAKYEVTDFTPVGVVASQPLVLVASQRTGVKNLEQFLAVVRQNPGKFGYGTSGSLLQLAGEMLKQQAGLAITHVPYRGAAPLVNDLLGSHVDFGVMVLSGALQHIRSGKIIAIGTTEEKRTPMTPDVPALGEHPQLKGYSINAWFAMMAPGNLPRPVLARLQKAVGESLQSPELRKTLEDNGSLVAQPIADLPKFLADEVAKYRRIVEVAKIKE